MTCAWWSYCCLVKGQGILVLVLLLLLLSWDHQTGSLQGPLDPIHVGSGVPELPAPFEHANVLVNAILQFGHARGLMHVHADWLTTWEN